ncbi:hypothetical protein SKAU_G00214860 [Synaphobranchus kaupii]|uniref:Uncharacterized protein n=1 Tax=Synaphobranchus kaupii TaxID=118154 RepID=A0A9Q1F9H8_SYNKA|nr:hypothetical protein SKAU_G00214860 [Synaphobranchus kaupii]
MIRPCWSTPSSCLESWALETALQTLGMKISRWKTSGTTLWRAARTRTRTPWSNNGAWPQICLLSALLLSLSLALSLPLFCSLTHLLLSPWSYSLHPSFSLSPFLFLFHFLSCPPLTFSISALLLPYPFLCFSLSQFRLKAHTHSLRAFELFISSWSFSIVFHTGSSKKKKKNLVEVCTSECIQTGAGFGTFHKSYVTAP